MPETPRSLFPACSEIAVTTVNTLRRVLSPDEKADLEEALHYARGEVQSLANAKQDVPEKLDQSEKSRSDLWLDWDDWGKES